MSKNPKPGDESASPGVPGLGSSGFSTATMSAPAPKFSFGVQPSGGKKRAVVDCCFHSRDLNPAAEPIGLDWARLDPS